MIHRVVSCMKFTIKEEFPLPQMGFATFNGWFMRAFNLLYENLPFNSEQVYAWNPSIIATIGLHGRKNDDLEEEEFLFFCWNGWKCECSALVITKITEKIVTAVSMYTNMKKNTTLILKTFKRDFSTENVKKIHRFFHTPSCPPFSEKKSWPTQAINWFQFSLNVVNFLSGFCGEREKFN